MILSNYSHAGEFGAWSRHDGTLFPVFKIELDPDDTCPDVYVTKQFWTNLYSGVEQWRNESK